MDSPHPPLLWSKHIPSQRVYLDPCGGGSWPTTRMAQLQLPPIPQQLYPWDRQLTGSVEWLLLLLLPLLSLLPWDWDVFVSGVEVARPVGTTPSKSMVDGTVCLSIPLVVLRCQHSARGLHSTCLRSRDLRADSLLDCFRFCFLSSLSSWTICTWYKHSLWWVGCIFPALVCTQKHLHKMFWYIQF